MKILHIIPSLNPSAGGPVAGLKLLSNAIIQQGHTAEIATLDEPSSNWLQGLHCPVYALGPSKWRYSYSKRLLPWLLEHARNYDAIIVEGIWQYHSYATWRALRKLNIPYFVFSHGMLSPWFKKKYPFKHLKKWLYWPWADYRVLRDAKAVLFTSEEEKVLARDSFWLYRCNEQVVGYGTVAPSGNPELLRSVFFEHYPNLRDKRLFLYLSRIHEVKGCDLLIEAFARVAEGAPALQLIMAGPDQTGWKKNLVELSRRLGIEDRITWTGMLSGDLKWGAFAAAEVFVLPSHQENFGVVVAEALANGLPTLISDQVNIWREVASDGAGIVAKDTLSGTVELLSKWLKLDAKELASMKRNAIACFQARFEISRAARNLINVIEEYRA